MHGCDDGGGRGGDVSISNRISRDSWAGAAVRSSSYGRPQTIDGCLPPRKLIVFIRFLLDDAAMAIWSQIGGDWLASWWRRIDAVRCIRRLLLLLLLPAIWIIAAKHLIGKYKRKPGWSGELGDSCISTHTIQHWIGCRLSSRDEARLRHWQRNCAREF